MKNALMVYSHPDGDIFNVGDYVQSIAARQFLPTVDCFLDREHLNGQIDESVRMIMNGWFMHRPQNWPPSPRIQPLFIAFHINKLAEEKMLSPEGVRYLRDHQPIGCRDFHTVALLKGKGIDAYYSSCLTLTLGETYSHSEADDAPIYITDLLSTLPHTLRFKIKCGMALVFKHKLLNRIRKQFQKSGIKRELKSIAAFYATYGSVVSESVLKNAVYREQQIPDTFGSDDEKFAYADALLRDYSKARYVITSRIHCALPCLAMGTPVVFVNNDALGEVHNCRLDGLIQLFHTIQIGKSKVSLNLPGVSRLSADTSFRNKPDYRKYAEESARRCRSFVEGERLREDESGKV